MQADPVTIEALRPRLEKLAELLSTIEFTLPTSGREDAEQVRTAVIRTITEYLIPRLDEPEAPIVAAVIGSSGTGKSTVVNSLANDRISDVGPLRPTTRNPVLWAHRDHGGRYWSEFVARVRDRVGPAVEVVIGDDELTQELTLIDTPPAEYLAPSGRSPAVDALALADLCVFVTSPSRYADISAWEFLREIRWRGVPMLFVLNRLPPDREEAVALLNDFAGRLYSDGLLLEPDAAMVFGVSESVGDRWHGGLDPASVGSLRNELGAVSNTGYRATLVSMTAFTTGRNVVDRCQVILDEFDNVAEISRRLNDAVDTAYGAQLDEITTMIVDGGLRDMATHRTWSEAAVDLTAIVTRRAGVAAQETAAAWMDDQSGAALLEGKGSSLWRHTEDTSWDVQGRLEEWEDTLGDVAARNSKSGSLRPRAAKRIAARAWRSVVDPSEVPGWSVRRRFRGNLSGFIAEAQGTLSDVVQDALEVDASRFRNHLRTDSAAANQLLRHMTAISAMLRGEQPQLESIPAGEEAVAADDDTEIRADDGVAPVEEETITPEAGEAAADDVVVQRGEGTEDRADGDADA